MLFSYEEVAAALAIVRDELGYPEDDCPPRLCFSEPTYRPLRKAEQKREKGLTA